MNINCATCGMLITRQAHFYPYVMIVTQPKPGDPMPVFCGIACMLGFVAKKKETSVQEVTRDYEDYERFIKETVK